jgi:DNA-binding NarL/FixJ family response regulator
VTIEERRDLVVNLYVREGLSEREIAGRVGWSPATVHSDLVARVVVRRSQTAGLKRGADREELERLQDGHRAYRADVERAKAERSLIGTDELLERLRRAGAPRSQPAIVGYVEAGLIEPERDLGFAKPWLFTEAAADELVRRLQSDHRGRRFNPSTAAAARFRATWYLARHKSHAEFGRLASVLAAARGTKTGRPRGSRILTPEVKRTILARRAEGLSNRAIARELHVSEPIVRRFVSGAS